MSTISIMPIGKKIKIKKRTEMRISSMLATAANLKPHGFLLGGNLMLEENSVMRVEAFSASVSEKSYPNVRISVFPEGGKMGTLYVTLDNLDGLTWEPVDEVVKAEPKPTRRLDVDFKPDFKDTSFVWHESFGEKYDTLMPSWKIINPLKLSPEELKFQRFFERRNSDAGTAIVKIDKEVFQYYIQYQTDYHFKTKIDATTGLLSAKFDYVSISLNIKQGWCSNEEGVWHTLLTEAHQGDEDHLEVIKKYLKEKHGL